MFGEVQEIWKQREADSQTDPSFATRRDLVLGPRTQSYACPKCSNRCEPERWSICSRCGDVCCDKCSRIVNGNWFCLACEIFDSADSSGALSKTVKDNLDSARKVFAVPQNHTATCQGSRHGGSCDLCGARPCKGCLPAHLSSRLHIAKNAEKEREHPPGTTLQATLQAPLCTGDGPPSSSPSSSDSARSHDVMMCDTRRMNKKRKDFADDRPWKLPAQSSNAGSDA
jgi:hypothetical protein